MKGDYHYGTVWKKKQKEGNAPCCCGGNFNAESMAQAEQAKTEGADIKILGSGCAKCNQLEAAVKAALEQLNMDASIDHITDFTQIAAYGVMTTPPLSLTEKWYPMERYSRSVR